MYIYRVDERKIQGKFMRDILLYIYVCVLLTAITYANKRESVLFLTSYNINTHYKETLEKSYALQDLFFLATNVASSELNILFFVGILNFDPNREKRMIYS